MLYTLAQKNPRRRSKKFLPAGVRPTFGASSHPSHLPLLQPWFWASKLLQARPPITPACHRRQLMGWYTGNGASGSPEPRQVQLPVTIYPNT